MKWIAYTLALLTFSCGKPNTPKTQQKNEPVTQLPKEYGWLQPLQNFQGELLEIYGFIWFDIIQGQLNQGTYHVYERPNCYQCPQVKVNIPQDLVLIDMLDTTFQPDTVHAQWRLVKITGSVNNEALVAQKIERSVYSYPDYENSGYKMITDSLVASGMDDHTHVYADGVIQFKGQSFMEGYSLFSLRSTRTKAWISVYIKQGNQANQCDQNNLVKDMNGHPVRSIKVRVYGSWKNFKNPAEMKEAGMIFVENIQPL
jgi:hypothetical protein